MLNVLEDITQSFTSVEETIAACEREAEITKYRPAADFNGQYFEDDGRLGEFQFSTQGVKKLISLCGGGKGLYQTLKTIERPGLASQVVNDLLGQDEVTDRLSRSRFVTQEGTIIGVVGSRYEAIPNLKLVTTKPEKMVFDQASLVGSRLTLRQTDTQYGLEMKSHGMDGKDFIRFGMELRNDMVGQSALSGAVLTERMLCTNQMVHRTKNADFRQIHVGDGLEAKLAEIITLTRDQYEVIEERFKALSYIEFNPYALACLGAPVDLLPEIKAKRLFKPHHSVAGEARDLAITQTTDLIAAIPNQYGGETTKAVWNSSYRDRKVMFDFCETFTEAAKSDHYTSVQKADIECEAGELVEWIVRNKKRIAPLSQAA